MMRVNAEDFSLWGDLPQNLCPGLKCFVINFHEGSIPLQSCFSNTVWCLFPKDVQSHGINMACFLGDLIPPEARMVEGKEY